jgi:hypothetical protein
MTGAVRRPPIGPSRLAAYRPGNSERAEIRVKWPDGEWSHPYRVFASQFVIVDRTRPVASYWYPD